MTIVGWVFFAAFVSLFQAPTAQTASQTATQTTGPAAPGGAPAKYLIGAQDQLKISVYDADELTGTYRVDADGFITFPLLNRVEVAGLTLAHLSIQIAVGIAVVGIIIGTAVARGRFSKEKDSTKA